MPEDRTTQAGSGSASGGEQGAPPIAHEDIMQRLLEYQRKLREGLSPREAAQAVAEAVAGEGASPTGQIEQAEQGTEPQAEPVITATQPEPVVDLTAAEAELEERTAREAGSADREPSAGEVAVAEPAAEAPPGPTAETPSEPAAEASGAVASAERTEAAAPAAPAAGSVWAVPTPSREPDLAARVEQLERTLASVSQQVSELRQRFQDMAIAADERLAELERTLSRARRSDP